MKIKIYALACLETLINKLLKLDSDNIKLMKSLKGNIACIEITNLKICVYIQFYENEIALKDTAIDDNISLKISGNSDKFLSLLFSNSQNVSFQGIEVSGSLDAAKNLHSLITGLEIDWEEQLSIFTGDIAAHQIGNFARSTKSKVAFAAKNMQEMLTEYILYEAHLVPTKEEVAEYINSVDCLRNDIERLEARINNLAAQQKL